MSLISKRFRGFALSALLGLGTAPSSVYAQFRVGGAIQNDIAFDAGARRGVRAGFNRGDVYGAYGGFYPGYGESPIGGYMRGYADVISSVSQGMVDEQQSRMMREQVNQAKIDTRRKQYDEWLYERNTRPTVEDDRERQRIENIRRSRNNPPPNEIWSGTALNDILTAIQQQEARNVRGPTIPVDPATVNQINVTSGATNSGNVGLLRDGGKLKWPTVLQRPAFDTERNRVNTLFPQAYEQARSGAVEGEMIDALREAVNRISEAVSRQVSSLTPTEYSQGKRYAGELENTIKMLEDPNVANYVSKKWAAKGNTVGEVVDNMTKQGLKFAPATQGDQAAYNAMYTGMVAYLQWEPSRAWDTLTK